MDDVLKKELETIRLRCASATSKLEACNQERAAIILRAIEAGCSLREIASALDVSFGRIRDIRDAYS